MSGRRSTIARRLARATLAHLGLVALGGGLLACGSSPAPPPRRAGSTGEARAAPSAAPETPPLRLLWRPMAAVTDGSHRSIERVHVTPDGAALYTNRDVRVRVVPEPSGEGSGVSIAPAFTGDIEDVARCADGWVLSSDRGVVAWAADFMGRLERLAEIAPRAADTLQGAGSGAWLRDRERAWLVECGAGSARLVPLELPTAPGERVEDVSLRPDGGAVVRLRGGAVLHRAGSDVPWTRPSLGAHAATRLSRTTAEGVLLETTGGPVLVTPAGAVRDADPAQLRRDAGEQPVLDAAEHRAYDERMLAAVRRWRGPSGGVPLPDGTRVLDRPTLRARLPSGRWLESEEPYRGCTVERWGERAALLCHDGEVRVLSFDDEQVHTTPVGRAPPRRTMLSDDGRHAAVWNVREGELPGCAAGGVCLLDVRAGEGTPIRSLPRKRIEELHVHGTEIVARYGEMWFRATAETRRMQPLPGEMRHVHQTFFTPDGTLWGIVRARQEGARLDERRIERLLVRTGDGFEERSVPQGTLGVRFWDGRLGVAAGHSPAAVWASRDGGRHWEDLPAPDRLDADAAHQPMFPAWGACVAPQCRLGPLRLLVERTDVALPDADADWRRGRILGRRTAVDDRASPPSDAVARPEIDPSPILECERRPTRASWTLEDRAWWHAVRAEGDRQVHRWIGRDAGGTYVARAVDDSAAAGSICRPAYGDRKGVAALCCGEEAPPSGGVAALLREPGGPCTLRWIPRRGEPITLGEAAPGVTPHVLELPDGRHVATALLGDGVIATVWNAGGVITQRHFTDLRTPQPALVDGRVAVLEPPAGSASDWPPRGIAWFLDGAEPRTRRVQLELEQAPRPCADDTARPTRLRVGAPFPISQALALPSGGPGALPNELVLDVADDGSACLRGLGRRDAPEATVHDGVLRTLASAPDGPRTVECE